MERILLLVDDEENITSALMRLLRRDGYTILRANSGRAGLDLLAQHKVGVIISDQRMPEMTGAEFLLQVKKLYPDTVRIVLSGYTELNSVTDAINRGAIYKFLTKPWEDDLLRANVDEAFRYHEMKMENASLRMELQHANDQLLEINHALEKRVEKKSREAMFNLDVLRVSQEILEHLPMAVLGIGEDGLIAIANQTARQLFAGETALSLLGEMARNIMPAELLSFITAEKYSISENKELRLADGKVLHCWRSPMGATSHSKGVLLVIMT